jgi:hypothetical protein
LVIGLIGAIMVVVLAGVTFAMGCVVYVLLRMLFAPFTG